MMKLQCGCYIIFGVAQKKSKEQVLGEISN